MIDRTWSRAIALVFLGIILALGYQNVHMQVVIENQRITLQDLYAGGCTPDN